MTEYASWADVPPRPFGNKRPPAANCLQAADGLMRSMRAPDGLVLAIPGDMVTCPDGHPVFRVVKPVLTGSKSDRACFARFDCDEPPPPGGPVTCPECGCEAFPPLLDHPGRYAMFVNGKIAKARR